MININSERCAEVLALMKDASGLRGSFHRSAFAMDAELALDIEAWKHSWGWE